MKEFLFALAWIVIAAIGGNIGLWFESMEGYFRDLKESYRRNEEQLQALALDLKEIAAHVMLLSVDLERKALKASPAGRQK